MFWLKALLKEAELDGMVQNSCNLQSVICGGLTLSMKNLPDGKLVEHPKTHAPSAQINYSYPFIKRTSYISCML